MLSRALTVLLATLLLASNGVASGLSYLCRMHGEVHQQCCCKKSEVEAPDDNPKFERANRCCEALISDASQAPTAARNALTDLPELPTAVVTASAVASLPDVRGRDVEVLVRARAPPSRAGPPLFVWNCSYLI